ncbi:MAG: type II-B CRISPR-associated RNA-guided endonuclease Cas9/Csx12 [Leptospiraceae bacterium]|nr:type II-B CRISPR-associated RNA-guided endonuclease Cas9/Csx12 [Leptospiraceae bacterium]
MGKENIISPISIDMGARHTGVALFHYPAGEAPEEHADKTSGATIVFNENSLTLSQTGRRQKRHQTRGFKRRNLVKRLFRDILKAHAIDFFALSETLQEFLMGLFNRRGFSYLSEGLNQEVLREADPIILNLICGADIFQDGLPVLDQCILWSNNMPAAQKFMELELLQAGKKETNKSIKLTLKESFEDIETEQIKAVQEQISALQEFAQSIVKAIHDGHHHRHKYFENIKADLLSFQQKADSKEFNHILKQTGLKIIELARLIGNLSNLQLKPLRKYYNDPLKKVNQTLDLAKLQKLYIRWVRSFRPDERKEEGSTKRKQELLLELKKMPDDGNRLLAYLSKTDPGQTIPPYEDQNNRRTPKCQSLHLAIDGLYKTCPNWLTIVDKLLEAEQKIAGSSLPMIASNLARQLENHVQNRNFRQAQQQQQHGTKPRTQSKKAEHMQGHAQALLLHRFLDRSMRIDPYRTRKLATYDSSAIVENNELHDASKQLTSALGAFSVEYLKLAALYYSEREAAHQGVWNTTNNQILENCGGKPRLKKRMPEQLIGPILGKPLTANQCAELHGFLKNEKLGRSSLLGICKKIEEVRKKAGNGFALLIKDIEYKQHSLERKGTRGKAVKEQSGAILDDEEKSLKQLLDKVPNVAGKIADFFNLSYYEQKRFENPFSLAQIYNILEGDTGGFHRTCPLCTLENLWRSLDANSEYEKAANASRLPAQSLRPFDGWVARLCEANAVKIAHLKLEQVKKEFQGALQPAAIGQIHIPIVVEQNAFHFTADLSELKGSANRQKARQRATRSDENWLNKWERIKAASGNICPYSGQAIGKAGEIDHIIPRSKSRDTNGTVFNSEANLIYASVSGNQQKGNTVYTLQNLAPAYLKKQFKTTNIQAIEIAIEGALNAISSRTAQRVIFDQLDDAEQKALRHALFSSNQTIHDRAKRMLATAFKARVNGTQAYLLSCIYKHLRRELAKQYPGHTVEFSAIPVDARQTQKYRQILAEKYPEYTKQVMQGAGSHVIDATLAFAAALLDDKNTDTLQAPVPQKEDEHTAVYLKKLITDSLAIKWLQRREKYNKNPLGGHSIFKEGMYAEHFVPMWLRDGQLKIGFGPQSAVVIEKGATGLLRVLLPYLKNTEGLPDLDSPDDDNADRSLGDCNLEQALLIDKQKAIAYLHKYTRGEVESNDKRVYTALNGLYYTTQKQNVSAQFFEQGKFKGLDAALPDDKKTEIKIVLDLKTITANKKGVNKCSFSLELPLKSEWRRLLQEPLFQDLKKGAKEPAEMEQVLRDFFAVPARVWDHQKVRKVFALPIKADPAGAFRIQRGKPNGSPVFQMLAIDGNAVGAFPIVDDKVDNKDAVILDALQSSKRLAPKDPSGTTKPDAVAHFDEWRRLVDLENMDKLPTGLQKLELAPGSKTRMYLRLGIALDTFNKHWLPLLETEATKLNLLNVPAKLKFDKSKKDAAKKLLQNIAMPRNDMNVLFIDSERIELEYIVESNTNGLFDLYNKALPVQ